MNLKLLKVLFLVFAKLTEGADAIDNGQVLNLGVMPTVPYEALAGYLVIDLSDRLAGSFCAKTLGLYGSEVIKIEPPEGDPLRKLDHTEDETDESDSPLFLHLNAGKKSLTLNLETREGKEILSNLLEKADILVETFIPGKLASMGFSYEDITKHNPGLIMTSITPFGQTGPYKNFKYTELTVFAMSGGMHREGLPERYPLRYGAEVAQYYAGNSAAAATTSAIFRRFKANVGDWIDISIQECMAGHPHQIGRRAPFIYSGEIDSRTQPRVSAAGAREPYAVGTFRCQDGHVSFLPLGPRMWPNIARMIGREDLMYDPRFNDPDKRSANREALEKIFQSWLDKRTREEIFIAVQKAGVPGSPILRSDEVMENEQFESRRFFTEVDHPTSGTLKYTGDPFRLTAVPYKKLEPAPTVGQQTNRILKNHLQLSSEDILSLKDKGIV